MKTRKKGKEEQLKMEAVKEFLSDLDESDTMCRICMAEFVDPDDLKWHISGVHQDIYNENNFCKWCFISLSNAEDFAIHVRDYHLENLKSCPYCFRLFNNNSVFKVHKARHLIVGHKSTISCSNCPCLFKDALEVTKHEYEQHQHAEGIMINHCFPHLSSVLNMWVKWFFKGTYSDFHCSPCSYTTTELNEYIKHLKSCGKVSLVCNSCSKPLKNRNGVTKHIQLNRCKTKQNKKKLLECRICHKSFPKELFQEHSENCLKCSHCDEIFNDISKLAKHQATHRNITATLLYCKYCTANFITNAALDRHTEKLHKHELHLYKYKCMTCNKVYKHPKYLFQHYFGQHKELKPYKCRICNHKFKTRKSFTIHIKVVHKSNGNVKFDDNFLVYFTRGDQDGYIHDHDYGTNDAEIIDEIVSEPPAQETSKQNIDTNSAEQETTSENVDKSMELSNVNDTIQKDDTTDAIQKDDTTDAIQKGDTTDTTRKDDTTDKTRKDDTTDTTRKYDTIDPIQKDDTTRKYDITDTSRKDDTSDRTRKDDTTRKYDITDTSRKDDTSDRTRKDDTTDTIQKYDTIDAIQKDDTIDAIQKDDTTLKDDTTDTTRKDDTTDVVQNPNSSDDDQPLSLLKEQPVKRKRRCFNPHKKINNRFTCAKCNIRCYTFQHYNRHMSLHSSKVSKQCVKCNKLFKKKIDLEEHVKSKHSHSQLTDTLKKLLERRKLSKGSVSEMFRRTVKKVSYTPSGTNLKITEYKERPNVTVKNFLENFSRDLDNVEKSNATITILNEYTQREPVILLTEVDKYAPKDVEYEGKLQMPTRVPQENVQSCNVIVKVLENAEPQKPVLNFGYHLKDVNYYDGSYVEYTDDYIYNDNKGYVDQMDADDKDSISVDFTPEASHEVSLRESAHPPDIKVVIPNLPNNTQLKIGCLTPQAPYFDIVPVKKILEEYKNSEDVPDISLPNGEKLVNVNPLEHLLVGKNVSVKFTKSKCKVSTVDAIKNALIRHKMINPLKKRKRKKKSKTSKNVDNAEQMQSEP